MRLLHFTTTYAPAWKWGGPPRSVAALCEGLAACGHQVTVFTTNAGLENDRSITPTVAMNRNGVAVHYFPATTTPFGIRSRELTRAVAQRIGEFDLMHLSGAWQLSNPPAARAARRAGVPYVLSPRGMLQRYSFTQKPWKKRLWFLLAERTILDRASAIHSTSRLEDEEMGRFRINTPRFVLPNCIPTNTWFRDDEAGRGWRNHLQTRENEVVLLYAGRMHHKKGLELLPGVVAALAASRAVRLVLAGPDEDGTKAHLQTAFRIRGLADSLTVTGPLGTDSMRAAYSGADLFVFPSLEENFGNVAIEALACGCPVVMSDGIGSARDLTTIEFVRIAPRRVEDWHQAIENLLVTTNDTGVRTRVVNNVVQRFGNRAVAASMAVEYERLVAKTQLQRQRV